MNAGWKKSRGTPPSRSRLILQTKRFSCNKILPPTSLHLHPQVMTVLLSLNVGTWRYSHAVYFIYPSVPPRHDDAHWNAGRPFLPRIRLRHPILPPSYIADTSLQNTPLFLSTPASSHLLIYCKSRINKNGRQTQPTTRLHSYVNSQPCSLAASSKSLAWCAHGTPVLQTAPSVQWHVGSLRLPCMSSGYKHV